MHSISIQDIFQYTTFHYFPNSKQESHLLDLKQFMTFYMTHSKSTIGILIHALTYYIRYCHFNHPLQKSPSPSLKILLFAVVKQSEVLDVFRVEPLFCHRRIFMASLICSHKYNREPAPSNKAWAKLSIGISSEELTGIERVFLNGISYALYVQRDAYFEFSDCISNWQSKNF